MSLNVYLHFNGNCREAFEFYRSIFGGEFDIFTTFDEAPGEFAPPPEEAKHVMHVSYTMGDSVLMGSDSPSNFGPPATFGNNFSLSYQTKSRDETDDLFAKLSEGGKVTMPLGDMFWGSYFGACIDKFGITWMLNYDAPQS